MFRCLRLLHPLSFFFWSMRYLFLLPLGLFNFPLPFIAANLSGWVLVYSIPKLGHHKHNWLAYQNTRWPWKVAQRQFQPNGTNRGQYLARIDCTGSTCLGSTIQCDLKFWDPRKLFWQWGAAEKGSWKKRCFHAYGLGTKLTASMTEFRFNTSEFIFPPWASFQFYTKSNHQKKILGRGFWGIIMWDLLYVFPVQNSEV